MMLTAYRMVSSREFNEKILAVFAGGGYSSQTSVGRQLEALRQSRIRNLLDEEIEGFETSLPPTIESIQRGPEDLWAMVLPKYRRYRESRSVNDLADSATVTELLGINVHELNRMVDSGIIGCLGNSTVLRDRVYSVVELSEQIELYLGKAKKSDIPTNSISLTSAKRVLKRFGFSMIDAVIWAFNAKLPFWVNPSIEKRGALKSVYLERASLVRLCEEEFYNRADDEVLTRQEVRDITCLSDNALNQVSQFGLLPSKRWCGHGAQFEIRTLKNFLSRFRSAKREAAILGVNSKTMKSSHPDLLDDHQILHLGKAMASSSARPSNLLGITSK